MSILAQRWGSLLLKSNTLYRNFEIVPVVSTGLLSCLNQRPPTYSTQVGEKSSLGNVNTRVFTWTGQSAWNTVKFGIPAISPAISFFHRGAKTEASKLRRGQIVDIKGKILEVVNANYTQGRARQAGNVQVELKDLKVGTKVAARFSPTDMIETIFVEYKKMQFLYTEDNEVHFMDPETYDQFSLDSKVVGEAEKWLSSTQPATVVMIQGQVMSVDIPDNVEMTVYEADPSVKGGTSDGRTMKNAVLENGVKIQVPGYVEAGDVVTVKSKDGIFVKRISKGEE